MSNVLQLPIISQKTIASQTSEISLGLSGEGFSFQAGQYIQLDIPKLLYPDPKGASRVFSIASSPNEKDKLSVAFRNSGSGFKRTLTELPLGTTVAIEGPFGFFTLPPDESQTIVFIAGGIGITPCLSMIRFATEQRLLYSTTLLYGNKDRESAAYLNELQELAKHNSRFILKNIFGRIELKNIEQHAKNAQDVAWYIVGPPPMVAEIRETLLRLGINLGRIYFEEFTGY